MPYFGDIYIPWVTDKDTSVTKDIVEKNFVNQPPQVYEITPDLESGTYAAILNETVHDKDESFEEQQDAVLSMVSRHGTEFPFDVSGDDGYISVSSATTSIDPRQEIREAEIDIRFLDSDDYNGSIVANPFPHRDGSYDSQVEPHESFIAFPDSINVVGRSSDHTLSTSEGDINLYIISDREVIEYEESELVSQRESICRLFNSEGERLYSDGRVVDPASIVNNTLVRCTYNSNSADIEYYDGSWGNVGSVQIPFNEGYASDNTNDNIHIIFRNDNESEVRRGFSFVRFNFTNESSFDFDSDSTLISNEDFYAYWEDSGGRDIIIVRTSSDGDFYTDSSQIGIDNLSSSEEYNTYLAIVPSNITVDDYARYIYNIGSRRRSFV